MGRVTNESGWCTYLIYLPGCFGVPVLAYHHGRLQKRCRFSIPQELLRAWGRQTVNPWVRRPVIVSRFSP